MIVRLWHFICPTCGSHFWTFKKCDPVNCPKASCETSWIPYTEDGAYQRGVHETVELPDWDKDLV